MSNLSAFITMKRLICGAEGLHAKRDFRTKYSTGRGASSCFLVPTAPSPYPAIFQSALHEDCLRRMLGIRKRLDSSVSILLLMSFRTLRS